MRLQNLLLILLLCAFAACSKSDPTPGGEGREPIPETQLSEDYFVPFDYNSLEYESAAIDGVGSGELGTIVANPYVVNGGAAMVDIYTSSSYDTFLIGVDGVAGSFSVDANDVKCGKDHYQIKLLISQLLSRDLKLVVAGERGGYQSDAVSVTSSLKRVNCSGLHICVTFDNDKDIDLHLYLPSEAQIGSEDEIYYGNLGEFDTSDRLLCGLELRSNDDGDVDHYRNESLFIPDSYLADGEYRVALNMYGNLNPLVATNYIVRISRDGENLSTVVGCFDVGEASNAQPSGYREVYKFSL